MQKIIVKDDDTLVACSHSWHASYIGGGGGGGASKNEECILYLSNA